MYRKLHSGLVNLLSSLVKLLFKSLPFRGLRLILDSDLQNTKPMNSIKKIITLASVRASLISPRQMKYSISRKDWVDFGLVLIISFLIVVYKINKDA